jgi:hypothetical protein
MRNLNSEQYAKLNNLLHVAITALNSGELDADTREFSNSMLYESDRGCVLIGSAHLDDAVGNLLRSAMIDDEKMIKSVFKGKMPLFGSFWAKTVTCYAFEQIDENTRDALDAIRSIRNDCAHSSAPTPFTKDQLNRLTAFLEPHLQVIIESLYTSLTDEWDAEEIDFSPERLCFIFVVTSLLETINKQIRYNSIEITFTPHESA